MNRVIFRVIVGVLMTLYIVYLLATSLPVAQRWTARVVQTEMAKVLGTDVTVGSVDWSILGYAQLDSVQVNDRMGYPMFFASRVSAKLSIWQLLQHEVSMEHAQVYGLKAALRQERQDSAWNFQFVVDALKGDDSPDSNPWAVSVNAIMLRRGQVMVDKVYEPLAERGFDPAHLVLRHITFNATIDKIAGDTVEVAINRLALEEQSGFRLTGLDARFMKHGKRMQLPQFVARLPHSVADVSAFWYDGDWKLGTNKMYLDCDDLAFLDPRLRGKGAVDVCLQAYGDTLGCMVDTLQLRHDALKLFTDAEVSFAPLSITTQQTALQADVKALADFAERTAALPAFMSNAEGVTSQGRERSGNAEGVTRRSRERSGNGYNLDFDGSLHYDSRYAKLDGCVYLPEGSMQLRADVADNDIFSVELGTIEDLDLKTLNKKMGLMSITASASGSMKRRRGEAKVSVPYVMFGGYNYREIEIKSILGDTLDVDFGIHDLHVQGNLSARADIARRALLLEADVTRFRPDPLDGKWNFDTTSYSGHLKADVVIPEDVTKATGFVALRDFCRNGRMLADSLVVTSARDSVQDVSIKSSFMTVHLLTRDLQRLIKHREDSVLQASVRLWDDALLDSLFGVRLSLLDTLRVDVSGAGGPLRAKLIFDSGSEDKALYMDALAGYWRDSVWLDVSLLSPGDAQGNGRVEAHTALRDSLGLGRIDAKLYNINVGYILNLVNFHSVEFDGWASGDAELYTRNGAPFVKGLLDVRHLTMNDAYMGDLDLLISFDAADGRIGLDGMIVDVPQSHVTHAYGYVIPGHKPTSGMDLLIDTRRINAAFVNDFTRGIFEDIEGRVSGTARVHGKFSQIDLDGDLMIDTVSLKVPMLGTGFQAKGDSVLLRPGVFRFPSIHMNDGRGGTAVVSGDLRHNHFDDINYDFDITAENLLGYSFNTFGDMPFYATAYATGNVKLDGEPGRLNVNIVCTPQKGTTLVYDTATPTATNADFVTYARLSDSPDEQIDVQAAVEEAASSTDIILHFDLDITPDAHLRVITDAVAGDGLDLYGTGRITADYYNKGSFKMYGQYVVDHGEYNLSIQNFLHKQFKFRDGGTLTFSGAPLQGDLNLQAVYQVGGVSLNDLSARATFNSSSVRVDCIMNLGGKCEQPRVTFDFDLPNVNEDEKQMVRSLISTDEERNMQVLYLLGIGRFYSYDSQSGGQGNMAMKSLLSSTLSSTLNNVIGNALGTSNWSFGTAIATGDIGWSDMDIEGLVSGRLFNNRLLVNGQFGYRDRTTTGSNFIGDFDLKWTLVPSGNIALKAYSETNDRYFTKSSLTTQGVGLVLKKDFNRLGDMFKRSGNKRNKKQKQQDKAKKQE